MERAGKEIHRIEETGRSYFLRQPPTSCSEMWKQAAPVDGRPSCETSSEHGAHRQQGHSGPGECDPLKTLGGWSFAVPGVLESPV